MNFNNDILNELQTLSPILAGLPKTNVFEVPKGYFETLGDTVLICIKEEKGIFTAPQEKNVPQGYFENLSSSILDKIKAQQVNSEPEEALSSLLKNIQRINIFEVPQGYFENLPSSIINKIKIEADNIKAIETVSPLLLSVRNTTVFEVPQGYFENLSSSILDKIKSEPGNIETEESLSALLLSARNTNVFEVPQGYFENLSSFILNRINVNISAKDEIKSLSPLLDSVQHINVFEAPKGYFNTVSTSLIQAVKPAPAKVISMPKRNLFARLAAAAVITGVMALGVYKYTDKQPADTTAAVVKPVKLDPAIEQGKAMNDQQFTAALNNLSKDDITSYLEKNGSEEDVSMLTSETEVTGLPDKDDYLLNENTLQDYLTKIESQN